MTAYLFGDFRLDLARELLSGSDGPRVLRRKAFAVLRALLEAAPNLITLDQLLDRVWGRHAISSSAVPHVIAEVRRALGDDAQAPRYIETRHRRGYCFIAPVRRDIDAPAVHALLALLDDVHSMTIGSPRRRLEHLHRAATARGLTFLALQAQLALQSIGVPLASEAFELADIRQ